MKKLSVSLVLLSLLAACSSTKPPAQVEDSGTKSDSQVNAPTTSNTGSNTGTTSRDTTTTTSLDPLDDPSSPLAKRSVYFGYDSSNVNSEDQATISAHARYLSSKSAQKVRLEGHADERGSNEYNLALGQRRAESIQKMFELNGVQSSQVEAVSYGEEKPKAIGHDESAWAQNRRADINYAR